MSRATVLVVEDDAALREALCDTLELAGYRAIAAADGQAALDTLDGEQPGMVISDVQMQPIDGHALLKKIKARWPDMPVVLMTAHGSIPKAVEAMHDGAVDYMVKPFEPEVLITLVSRYIRPAVEDAFDDDLVAVDPRTRELAELARRVAASDATVLISGESGTGKEVFARYIHRRSQRAVGPFVAINCAAIPENMLEAVLFGYEKGAFTGAYHASPGKFEQAQGGTLLLDEISEMSLALQAKLLRVLQEREVERLGGHKLIKLDVRVLATSNRNLRAEVAAGRFREDLFYRLNVFPLQLPSLRERRQDILPIAQRLIQRHVAVASAAVLSDEAVQRLLNHAWPGNVRELDNVMQRALILKSGTAITASDLHFEKESMLPQTLSPSAYEVESDGGLSEDLRSREQQVIIEALRVANGNRKDTAERLGVSERTLRYKLARLRESGVAIPD
ncbi:MAG: sigma-54-dependent Fis family transcriptional regulator [Gammaproteobacteria bacterium]|nr:sigma-54-dependent Fis family transcriptional regulator [Gammaproteobacteria bacterium]